MGHQVRVSAWVSIDDDCPMHQNSTEEVVYFMVGSPPDDFDLTFTTHSLARFVELAHHALQHATPDQDEPATPPHLAPMTR